MPFRITVMFSVADVDAAVTVNAPILVPYIRLTAPNTLPVVEVVSARYVILVKVAVPPNSVAYV